MSDLKSPYHVVDIRVNSVHQNYHIYKDNKPFLLPYRTKLTRLQARLIVKILNILD